MTETPAWYIISNAHRDRRRRLRRVPGDDHRNTTGVAQCERVRHHRHLFLVLDLNPANFKVYAPNLHIHDLSAAAPTLQELFNTLLESLVFFEHRLDALREMLGRHLQESRDRKSVV